VRGSAEVEGHFGGGVDEILCRSECRLYVFHGFRIVTRHGRCPFPSRVC
jgi:hypothetical protein